jgi:high-affinity iron transporter
MLPAFLLSLREGLEAALVIGIVLGALRKIKREELASSVWLGAGLAALVSLLAALGLGFIGFELEGAPEQIFEGVTMFIAAGILTWMIFWMSSQSRQLKASLEDGVNKATHKTGRAPLFWLAFLAVVREGIELAIFLVAALFAGDTGNANLFAPWQIFAGAVIGLAAATLVGWGLFAATIRMDLRRFFQVTSVLLILFAAGLVAHGVHEFNEAGIIPVVIEPIWNLNAVLPEDSFLGILLKTLFGYNSEPSLTEILAYFAYLGIVGGVLIYKNRQPNKNQLLEAQV